MKSDKLLAEWFWIDRYDGSSAALMNMECQGLYRTMLSAAWRRGARLPNDHEGIQRAIRCTPEEWARCWPKVSRYWHQDDESLVNDTQLEVYAEAKAAQERASNRGKKGAQASAQVRAQARHKQVHKDTLKHQPPSPSPSPKTEEQTLVEFFNRLTGRRLTRAHHKFITPRLTEGATTTTLKLAIIGACLKPFHLGFNDRKAEYLDLETIFKPGRFDGHAEHARRATFRIPGADDVWQFWGEHLELARERVMRHFFEARDELLVEEGHQPIGPAAVRSDARPGEAWHQSA